MRTSFKYGPLDVVPPGEVGEWDMEPFGTGSVITDDDGKKWVYGRGAIDDKHSVFGILGSNSMSFHNQPFYAKIRPISLNLEDWLVV